jgi:hypothetical protein
MFTILIDTREKKPFTFSIRGVKEKVQKLDTGDYQIQTMESFCCIDRKASVSELYINLFKQYPRFKKELIRMGDFEEAYILCSFPYTDILEFPNSLPKKARGAVRYGRSDVINKIELVEDKYNAKFIFCNGREEAQDKTFEILERVWRQNEKD